VQQLISYYKIEDIENEKLRSLSSLPELASLEISTEYLDQTHLSLPELVSLEISAEYLDKMHFRKPPELENEGGGEGGSMERVSVETQVALLRGALSPSNSVVSITESIATRIYREEYGRILNDYSDVYRLPADEEEWERIGVFQFVSICSIRRRLSI
jgi:hypothetical protein